MGFVRTSERQAQSYQKHLVELESSSEYPLGEDSFKISHGEDYFKFFRRLGFVFPFFWQTDHQIVAVVAAVLRRVPFHDQKLQPTWYVCDLKVHPNYRGKQIPIQLLSRAFFFTYFRCRRFYAISMNSPSNPENRVAKLLKHFSWAPIKSETRLFLWSLSLEEMIRALPILEKHRGKVSFRSLSGVKDLILQSTGNPLPLLHAQFGVFADPQYETPLPNFAHMFCVPENDPLIGDLEKAGFYSSSSATVLSHRMGQTDWTWILTSDI